MSRFYFARLQDALLAAQQVDLAKCRNRFQDQNDTAAPKVVEFQRGHAVQLGDYGDYLTAADVTDQQALPSLDAFGAYIKFS